VPRTQVDDGQPRLSFRVVQRHIAVAGPHLIPCGLLGVAESGIDFLAVGFVEIPGKRPIKIIAVDVPPCQQNLDLVPEVAPLLADAPDESARIQARRTSPIAGPFIDGLAQFAFLRPLLLGTEHDQ